MNVSVELSLYPLTEAYLPPIQGFIERLKAHPSLKVIGNTMSTQVYGDYADVLRIVSEEMQATHQHTPKAAFMMKILNGDLSPE